MAVNVRFDTAESYWNYFNSHKNELYDFMRKCGFIGDVEEDISLIDVAIKLKDRNTLIQLIEGIQFRMRTKTLSRSTGSLTYEKFLGASKGYPDAA